MAASVPLKLLLQVTELNMAQWAFLQSQAGQDRLVSSINEELRRQALLVSLASIRIPSPHAITPGPDEGSHPGERPSSGSATGDSQESEPPVILIGATIASLAVVIVGAFICLLRSWRRRHHTLLVTPQEDLTPVKEKEIWKEPIHVKSRPETEFLKGTWSPAQSPRDSHTHIAQTPGQSLPSPPSSPFGEVEESRCLPAAPDGGSTRPPSGASSDVPLNAPSPAPVPSAFSTPRTPVTPMRSARWHQNRASPSVADGQLAMVSTDATSPSAPSTWRATHISTGQSFASLTSVDSQPNTLQRLSSPERPTLPTMPPPPPPPPVSLSQISGCSSSPSTSSERRPPPPSPISVACSSSEHVDSPHLSAPTFGGVTLPARLPSIPAVECEEGRESPSLDELHRPHRRPPPRRLPPSLPPLSATPPAPT